MVNIKTAETVINSAKKYTSNGGRLISKNTNLKLDEKLKRIANNIPQNAESIDIVKLETNFGASSQRIVSFKDKAGKLIKRFVSKYEDNKLTSKTVNTYDHFCDNYRTASRQTYSNGKKVQEVREQFGFDSKNNLLGHTKLTITKDNTNARHEHQIFETFTKKSQDRRFLETEAQRDSKGRMINKTLRGNIENLDSFKSDPYLYIRNYNDDDFLNAASNYAKKVQQVEGRSINISNKSLSNNTLGYSRSLPGYKEIKVDVAKHSSRGELIDTVNHEFRHQYQDELQEKQGIINYTLNRDSAKLSKKENEQARIFRNARWKYTQPEKNFMKYYNNELEKDARDAGEKAKNIYNDSSNKLSNAFPKADQRLFDLRENFLANKIINLFASAQKVILSPIQINKG